MRSFCIAILTMAATACIASAQDEAGPPDPLAVRYEVQANALTYPQKSPEEAIKSIVRALEKKRMEYLVAHLADPKLVDARIAEYRQAVATASDEARTLLAFERLQRETQEHLSADPQLLRELRLFAREAEWQVTDNEAVGVCKDVPEHKVFMRRIGARWFLQNRQQ